MRHKLLLFLLVTIGLFGLSGYCYALVDWATDVRTGVYGYHQTEAFLETLAIVLYTGLGIRFAVRTMDLF